MSDIESLGEFIAYISGDQMAAFDLYRDQTEFLKTDTLFLEMPPSAQAIFEYFAAKLVYDAKVWNYTFEIPETSPAIQLDAENRTTEDVILTSYHGDGRLFHYTVELEKGSLISTNAIELTLNTPNSNNNEHFRTSLVHVRTSMRSTAIQPFLANNGVIVMQFDTPVALSTSAQDYEVPDGVVASGYIDVTRNSMSITFRTPRGSIYPLNPPES